MCLQGAVFLRNSIESVVSIERLPENVSFSTASGGMRSSRPTVNMAVLGGFMKICEQLHMIKGITAVIGSGGKTTLLRIIRNGDFDDFHAHFAVCGHSPVGDG